LSFRQVRRIYLADVPLRHSDLVQRASRCVRLGGHAGLPEEERTIAVELHTAQLPKFLRHGPGSLIYRELINAKEVSKTPGVALEMATLACLETLKEKDIKTILELQQHLQAEDGEKFIHLLTETALEHLGDTSELPARPLGITLRRLKRGGDDLVTLESALKKQVRTADEELLEWLVDKSAELLPPLEAMRMGAVDRQLLAPLGDPPRAPPPRTEAARKKVERARKKLEAIVVEGVEPGEETAVAENAGSPPECEENPGGEDDFDEDGIELDDDGDIIDDEDLDDDPYNLAADLEGGGDSDADDDDEGMAAD